MCLRGVRTLGVVPVALTAPLSQGLASAVDAGAFSLMLLLLVAIVVPVAAIAFSRSGRGLDELGKGRFAVDFDRGGDENREEELRQLVEARAWRWQARGEDPGDVEAEIERMLSLDPDEDPNASDDGPTTDPGLRDEIRQVVLAKNESRERRGEPPLDVEAEVERLLGELT